MLFNIIEKEKWQKMQEGFSRALGVNIQTVNLNGRPFPGINEPCSFCEDMLKACRKNCWEGDGNCISQVINKFKKNKDENYITCPFGLHLYVIPVDVKGQGTLAYIIVGPVMLQAKKDPEEYKKIAKETRIPLDYLTDRLLDFKKFSFVGIESAVDLLREVAHYIVQLNYDFRSLKSRFSVPKVLDGLIKELYSAVHFDELLNALLDACLNTTKGSSGSIMLLDRETNELTVKFSKGLSDDIIRNAKVKIGEGISGIAAKDKKPLLIDSDTKNAKIKNRLKRPHIKSSIVYPLEAKNKVFGVINLNNTDTRTQFDSETLNIIGNFTHLAKIALGMFPKN